MRSDAWSQSYMHDLLWWLIVTNRDWGTDLGVMINQQTTIHCISHMIRILLVWYLCSNSSTPMICTLFECMGPTWWRDMVLITVGPHTYGCILMIGVIWDFGDSDSIYRLGLGPGTGTWFRWVVNSWSEVGQEWVTKGLGMRFLWFLDNLSLSTFVLQWLRHVWYKRLARGLFSSLVTYLVDLEKFWLGLLSTCLELRQPVLIYPVIS